MGDLDPDTAHLRERLLEPAQAWRGHFLDVRRDRVGLPDGSSAQREYIVHPGAVMVVPLLDAQGDRLVVERQWRYPMGRAMLEFPAGKLEAGEAAIDCAERELIE
ncbi:MAG: NUDIX hydrolase, partial [Pseudomonadota bacterium]|nr:NUDIX hydrolase [Pseudomonadota bacterium]